MWKDQFSPFNTQSLVFSIIRKKWNLILIIIYFFPSCLSFLTYMAISHPTGNQREGAVFGRWGNLVPLRPKSLPFHMLFLTEINPLISFIREQLFGNLFFFTVYIIFRGQDWAGPLSTVYQQGVATLNQGLVTSK